MLPLELTLKQNIASEERKRNKPQTLQPEEMFRNYKYICLIWVHWKHSWMFRYLLALGLPFSVNRASSHLKNISNFHQVVLCHLSEIQSSGTYRQRQPPKSCHFDSTHRNIMICKYSSSILCVQVYLSLEKGFPRKQCCHLQQSLATRCWQTQATNGR